MDTDCCELRSCELRERLSSVVRFQNGGSELFVCGEGKRRMN